ncbi:cytochrome P450 2C42-like [Scyliorhinus canicula]|uniref:cytochrome P450 2C42-like n=1 Tax=Scyliorhinus canicula TaxID=7830 RepID=UPI0018F55B0F|nr:cytochrome P450 2C42-like [Scyliorhinus canicula]
MFLYSLVATMGLNGPGTTLLFVLLTILFIKWFHKPKQPWKSRLPPGPSALPILGNLFQVDRRATKKSLMKLGEQYGPVFTIWLGSCPAVVLCGHEAVTEALIERGHDFGGRYVLPVFKTLSNDYGIASSNGERWKQIRRFTLSTLKNFGMGRKSIEQRNQEEAQFLVTAIRNKKDTPFSPNLFLRFAVSNIICSLVFGDRFDYEDKRFLTLIEMISENMRVLSGPWIQMYNNFPTIMDFLPGPHKKLFQNVADLLNFIKQMIQSHKESLQKDFPRDYIDSFLIKMEEEEHKHDSEFIHMNLLWAIMDLFFAGTETTSTTLQWAIQILAKYPQVQEKIHGEIDEVVGSCRRPTVEDRAKMPYTDAVIHEVQRYIDLAPMGLPHAVTKDVEFRGYLIPEGTCVLPLLSSVLKGTSQWETPDKFNPNHFLDENGDFKQSKSFMPFSAGKRICLGESLARMELFLFLTTLLQNFVFKPVIDRKEIDISPVISGLADVPNDYEFYFISR